MTSQCQESFENDYADNRKDVACAHQYKEISELGEQGPGFTDTDIRLYKHRYQEDYDLYHDKQYSECVQKLHPKNKLIF